MRATLALNGLILLTIIKVYSALEGLIENDPNTTKVISLLAN